LWRAWTPARFSHQASGANNALKAADTPEPGTIAFVLAGLAGLVALRRR